MGTKEANASLLSFLQVVALSPVVVVGASEGQRNHLGMSKGWGACYTRMAELRSQNGVCVATET